MIDIKYRNTVGLEKTNSVSDYKVGLGMEKEGLQHQ